MHPQIPTPEIIFRIWLHPFNILQKSSVHHLRT